MTLGFATLEKKEPRQQWVELVVVVVLEAHVTKKNKDNKESNSLSSRPLAF
jgi:hypothetical protein